MSYVNALRGRASGTLLCAMLASLGAAAPAQPLGSAFTYQGQLRDAGQPANGLYDLQLCLYDTPANPVTLGCAPEIADAPVEGGLFATTVDFGSAAFVGQERYLELRVRPGASSGSYTVLAPRQLIRPAPEALRANVAAAAPWSGLSGIPAGFADSVDNDSGGTLTAVTAGAGLSGGTITSAGTVAIASDGVTGAMIASGAVGSAEIAPSAVDSARIIDASIAAADLGANSVGAAQLADAAVDSAAIVDGSVASADLSANSVGAAQLADAAVDSAAIIDGSVAAADLGSNAVGSAQLADAAVDSAALIDASVSSSKIAAGAVGLAQINTAQVQPRISVFCPVGSYLRGLKSDGTAMCGDLAGSGGNGGAVVDNPVNFVGEYSSIAIGADDLPIISYHDQTAGALKVAKCANVGCVSGTTINTIDDPGAIHAGEYTSIAIGAEGLPVISYFADALKVAKCANAACSGAATISIVDNRPAAGRYSAIAIGSDGLPIVSYQSDGLKVAKCMNAACTGAATFTAVDETLGVGEYTDIAIGADGLPVISYYDSSATALRVAKCINAACTGTSTITVVDNAAAVGQSASIVVGTDGRPVISYFDATASALKVAKCANPACTGAATLTMVDDPPSIGVGPYTSIALGSDGLPVISYYEFTYHALRVAKCANAACSGAATIAGVESYPTEHRGLYSSIAVGADGLPVISHHEATSGLLMLVKCGTRTCQ